MRVIGGAAAAVFLVVVHLAVAYFLAARLVAARRFLLRGLATLLVGMWLATAGFHVLALARIFNLPAACVALALLAGVVFGGHRARVLFRDDLARARVAGRRTAALVRESPRRGWIVAFGVVALTTVLRPWVLPPLGWDTQVYHALKAGLWVHSGELRFLQPIAYWALYRNYPAGGEVFTAWGMLPFHDDTLAVAPEAVQWAGILVAAIALGREMGLREPYATTAAGLFAGLPPLRVVVGSGYVEAATCLTFIGGLAFALRYLKSGDRGAFVLAAAGAGLAAATKLTVVPLAAFLMMCLLARAIETRRWTGVLAGLAAFLAVAAPWYVYNTVDTGRPFTPYVTLGGLELGNPTPGVRHFSKTLEDAVRPYDWAAEWEGFRRTFGRKDIQPEAFGFLSAVPFVVFVLTAPVLLLRRRLDVAVTLLGVVALNVLSLYGRDSAPLRMVWPESSSRFWLPAFAVAVPASALWCRRFPRAGRVYLWTLLFISFFHLLQYVHLHFVRYDTEALLALAVSLLLVVAGPRALPPGRLRAVLVLSSSVVLLALLATVRGQTRYLAYEGSTVIHYSSKAWIPQARAVDHPGQPHRVAVTGNQFSAWSESWFAYGMLGSRLQNDVLYVPVTKDGRIEEDFGRLTVVGDRGAWVSRLREWRIDYVVCLQPDTVEAAWMRELPELFEPLTADTNRGAWRLLPR
jgi:hypothetical protein